MIEVTEGQAQKNFKEIIYAAGSYAACGFFCNTIGIKNKVIPCLGSLFLLKPLNGHYDDYPVILMNFIASFGLETFTTFSPNQSLFLVSGFIITLSLGASYLLEKQSQRMQAGNR